MIPRFFEHYLGLGRFLLAYALVLDCDYATKAVKVGLAKAVMAINNATMRVGALSNMDIVLPALASSLHAPVLAIVGHF
jgi:hypothetical protein